MPIPPLAAADPVSVLPGILAAGGEPPTAWGGMAWTGAALYLLAFAVALYGVWRLLGAAPGREGPR